MFRYFFAGYLILSGISCSESLSELDKLISQTNNQFDIFISEGEVIDGTGSQSMKADILTRNDEIVFIGQVDEQKIVANHKIDAEGKIVSPGFIDTHAHGDPLKTPEFENFLSMGVTSIVLGQDGFSTPVVDISSWMDKVDEKKPATNILPFVGHSTLRELAEVNYEPSPSEAQIEQMGLILKKAMDSGIWGMSTGLEYLPGSFAKEAELHHLAKIVGDYDGLIMSHMRSEDEDEIEASIEELLGQGAFCDVHIAHFKVVYGKGEERAKILLQKLKEARKNGKRITADLYPYTASYTGIGIVFPDWAKAPNNYQSVKSNRRAELSRYLRTRVHQRNGPEATLLGTAPYAGKTLAQLSQEKGKPFEDILIDDIGPTGASGAYFVMNEVLQETLLKDSSVMVCSDGSPTMRHPRGYGTFARIIETFVNKRNALSLQEAIYKMTYLPAQTLKLKDRGMISEGMKADLLVFDPEAIKETANFESPHQLAQGFDWVMVNGKLAVNNGKITGRRYGKLLTK